MYLNKIQRVSNMEMYLNRIGQSRQCISLSRGDDLTIKIGNTTVIFNEKCVKPKHDKKIVVKASALKS